MKENLSTKTICVLLSISILAAGCASSTLLQTTPTHADIYIKGQRVGVTPYTYSDRKIAGASTSFTFRKKGYEDFDITIRKNKRLNIGALISGIFFIYPLFWVMGYDEGHSYDLEKSEANTQTAEIINNVEKTAPVKTDPEVKSVKPQEIPQNTKVKKMLTQGRIDKAIEYAKKQEGEDQSDCFFTIGEYYLGKSDYKTAEDFYNQSDSASLGYKRIAESLMRGEIVDSTMIINQDKAKPYLEKVYDNEQEILSYMASSYEKYAGESQSRISLLKKMKDMNIISMTNQGRTININRSLAIEKLKCLFYNQAAVTDYKKLNNNEKVEELNKKIDSLKTELSGDKNIKNSFVESDDTTNRNEGPAKNNITAEDDMLLIDIDSIAISATKPTDLIRAVEAAENSNTRINIRQPGKNENYVIIFFHTKAKKELYFSTGRSLAPSSLADESGNEYQVILERGSSYLVFPGGGRIMWNPKVKQPDGIIIKGRYLMFIMPENNIPVRLEYSYYYKPDRNSRQTNKASLSVNLMK